MSHVSTCPWLLSSHPPSFNIRLNTRRVQNKSPGHPEQMEMDVTLHAPSPSPVTGQCARRWGLAGQEKTAWYHPASSVMTLLNEHLFTGAASEARVARNHGISRLPCRVAEPPTPTVSDGLAHEYYVIEVCCYVQHLKVNHKESAITGSHWQC